MICNCSVIRLYTDRPAASGTTRHADTSIILNRIYEHDCRDISLTCSEPVVVRPVFKSASSSGNSYVPRVLRACADSHSLTMLTVNSLHQIHPQSAIAFSAQKSS